MPCTQTDHLFRLIKTLSKAEKRSFKLYVNRIGGAQTAKFIQLFDVLDKQKTYNEEVLFQKITTLKRTQLSNLKRHLYKQLLTSLRLIHNGKNTEIEIREQIDYATILYHKGLLAQSLKILDRAKNLAFTNHLDLLHLEILELTKVIESQHITKTIDGKISQLATESQRRTEILARTNQLSNLALRLYGFYLKIGHVKDQEGAFLVGEIFHRNLPKFNNETFTFLEKLYYYECHVWYYSILQNFPMHYRNAQKWVDLFTENPDMQLQKPNLYMRGLNQLLLTHFYMNTHDRYAQTLKKLEAFVASADEKFTTNNHIHAFLYTATARINQHFIRGTFTEGLKDLPNIQRQLENYRQYLDPHRVLIFHYKFACMYFGSGDNDRAIDHLNEIINSRIGNLRTDIQCYARILHLIAHYELGNQSLLDYLVKSVYRFLAKMEDLNAVQKEILKFLRRELYADADRLKKAFRILRANLQKIKEKPYEGRSFLYLDIIAWLDSKIQDTTVEEIAQRNFRGER